MSDWLADERLAPFAIRVLERIGQQPEAHAAVLKALREADVTQMSAPALADLDAAQASLGVPTRYRAGVIAETRAVRAAAVLSEPAVLS